MKRTPKGPQISTAPMLIPQLSFNLKGQDGFVTSLGVDFTHWRALPSPIGMKDRGDYRRPDSIDTLASNGMIFRKAGQMTATLVGNSKNSQWSSSSIVDYSTCRIIMPRYYNKGDDVSNSNRIHLAPGDRMYISDPDADILVSNYQKMEYTGNGIDVPMFPICVMEDMIDSRGLEYKQTVDFNINQDGNIEWVSGARNPGIDPDTNMGRVYSIRYRYKAFWYVLQIPNEVRISNVTEDGTRAPARMPEHAILVREYLYHNRNNDEKNLNTPTKGRQNERPFEQITARDNIQVSVNINDFTSEDQE